MIQWLGKERGVDSCCLLDMFSQIHYQKSFRFSWEKGWKFGVFQNSAYQRHHQHCSLAQKLVAKSKEFQGFFTSFGVIFKHCVQRKLKVQFLPIFTTLSLQRERRIKINPVFGYFQRVFYNHFYWKNLYSASIAIHSGMIGGLSGSKFNDR